MNRSAFSLSCLVVAGLIGAANTAEAKVRHRVPIAAADLRPLTVTKRSWLDMGNVVPVGSQNSYLSASTTLNQPVYSSYLPAKFGQSTLPDQFTLAFSNANPRGPESGGIFFDDVP